MITTTQNYSCAYYRRRSDRAVFALMLLDGRPLKAVGPLANPNFEECPASLNLRTGAKATDWNPDDFERVGEMWKGVGYRPAQAPKFE